MVLQWKTTAKNATINFTEQPCLDIIRKYTRAMNVELLATCGIQMEFNVNKATDGNGVLKSMTVHGTTERLLK